MNKIQWTSIIALRMIVVDVIQAMIMVTRMRTVLTLTLSYFRYNSDDSYEMANLGFLLGFEILK